MIRFLGWQKALALIIVSLFHAATAEAQPAKEQQSGSKRWLLLACGLPGDEQHRERLTTACSQVIDSIDKIGVDAANLSVLAGDDQMKEALAKTSQKIGVCTKESLLGTIAEISQQSKPEDECWIILLGHAHLYDRTSQFNISGPDIDQKEFALSLDKLPTVKQVLWLTFPVSGQWIRPASTPNRVIITATEADLEFTGTEMPYSLANAISQTDGALRDVDGDQKLTLFDLYVSSCLHVSEKFLKEERLQTEHSQLDDNADGRGSEVQAVYLQEKLEATLNAPAEGDAAPQAATAAVAPSSKKPPIASGSDGWLSQHILLRP